MTIQQKQAINGVPKKDLHLLNLPSKNSNITEMALLQNPKLFYSCFLESMQVLNEIQFFTKNVVKESKRLELNFLKIHNFLEGKNSAQSLLTKKHL